MEKTALFLILWSLPLVLRAQGVIDRIDIVGNERVTKETILYYLSLKEGDYYNEEILRRDFRVLWSTGFFANLKMEDLDVPAGKVVRITVEENPVVKAVTFKTGKKVGEDDIISKLKEKDEAILAYSYYSPYKLQRARKTIQELLAEKGLQLAKIDVSTERKGKNEVEVLFKIDEGPKVRVGAVEFDGVDKPKLPPSFLREALKDNQQHNLMSYVNGKDVFKQNKLAECADEIRKKLQESGYMEASVGEPRVSEMTRRTVLFKKQRMMRIVFPVNAGYPYRVGEVKVEGNKTLRTAYIRSLIGLLPGSLYSTKVREKAIKDIQELYANGGFLYAQIVPVESLDPKRKVVNVTFTVSEGEVVTLNRLEFRGNIFTKDKVIRREMLIREGDRFSLALFKDSVLRIKQLGLVDLEKEPDLKPDPNDPTKMNVAVSVKELQRNNIQFSAGYSGYEGTFVALSYSTVNFLGAGENLELMLQYGKRIKNYSFGFTEPYIFDRPISFGFNIFNRYYIIPDLYDQKSKGIDLTLGSRLFGYWRTSLTYSLQFINVKLPTETDSNYSSALLGYYGYGLGNYNLSSIEPTIYRSTVDSPLTPTRGTMYLASLLYAGKFLGGAIDLVKPHFEWSFYHPLIGHNVLGFHVDYSFVKKTGSSDIPFWQKFYLGGERSIRGYEIYSIGPRNYSGNLIGGLTSFVFNAEYIIPVGGPLYAIFFYDTGNAWEHSLVFNPRNLYASTGIEARVFVPALRVPFRLIFAYNSRKIYADDPNFAFRFAVGTTF
jgi:outer membrane protein insertion porin family